MNVNLTRSKRSNDAGYDKTYDKFISRNFPSEQSGYIDNGKSQRQTQGEESEEEESEEEQEQENDPYENNREYERIKAVSEDQAKKLSKKTANCKEYLQDGMICKSCKDPQTGDTSESCNYSSDPVDKKMAFTKSKNFAYDRHPLTDGDDEQEEPEEEVIVVSEPPKEELVTPSIKKKPLKRNYPRKIKKTKRLAKPKQQLKPEHREIDEANDYGAYKLADFNEDVADYDQPRSAQLKVYPGDAPVNAEQQENINTEYEILPQSEFNENNFEKVLSEFKKKDFSNCKKTTKGELTCYICKDRAGLKQEECMFVSQTNPKNKKISFTESKSFGKALKKRIATTTTEAPQVQQIPQNHQNYQQNYEQRTPSARYQRTRKPRVLAPTTSLPQLTFDHLNPIVAHDQIQKRTVKIKRKALVENHTPMCYNNNPTCYEHHVLHED